MYGQITELQEELSTVVKSMAVYHSPNEFCVEDILLSSSISLHANDGKQEVLQLPKSRPFIRTESWQMSSERTIGDGISHSGGDKNDQEILPLATSTALSETDGKSEEQEWKSNEYVKNKDKNKKFMVMPAITCASLRSRTTRRTVTPHQAPPSKRYCYC